AARQALRSAAQPGSPRTNGHFNAHTPLQHLRAVRLAAVPISTPPWDHYIPQDQNPNRLGRQSARLPNPPDSLSLPGVASIASFSTGSSFLGRYVSGGSLFLKPLGTFFT